MYISDKSLHVRAWEWGFLSPACQIDWFAFRSSETGPQTGYRLNMKRAPVSAPLTAEGVSDLESLLDRRHKPEDAATALVTLRSLPMPQGKGPGCSTKFAVGDRGSDLRVSPPKIPRGVSPVGLNCYSPSGSKNATMNSKRYLFPPGHMCFLFHRGDHVPEHCLNVTQPEPGLVKLHCNMELLQAEANHFFAQDPHF